MLIYKKSVKKPVIINAKEIDEDIKKILEEKKEEKLESIEMEKGKIYYIYENEKDAIEKNTTKKKEKKEKKEEKEEKKGNKGNKKKYNSCDEKGDLKTNNKKRTK